MTEAETNRLLSQLLALEYRSLPMYLGDATPWTHPGDEKATATIANIRIDQQAAVQRIATLILDRAGVVDPGDYPMEFTDTHFLSLDYLVKELIGYQKVLIKVIEGIVARFGADREAVEVAQEVLGSERGPP